MNTQLNSDPNDNLHGANSTSGAVKKYRVLSSDATIICKVSKHSLRGEISQYIKITKGGEKGGNDKSINEKLDGVHLVTGFVFAPRRSAPLAYISLTLTTCKLVAWERQTEAVKDLEPAVNGPRQFAFATRRRIHRDLHFPPTSFGIYFHDIM